MGFGIDKNGYGINRQEFNQLKKGNTKPEAKPEAKNDNIDFRKNNITNSKQAIETGNFDAHLDQIGEDMKGILGLHLTGKVDGTEGVEKAQTIAEITEIVKNVEFGDGVDTEKVLRYIINANIPRVQSRVEKTIEDITGVNAANFFNSDTSRTLDNIFNPS